MAVFTFTKVGDGATFKKDSGQSQSIKPGALDYMNVNADGDRITIKIPTFQGDILSTDTINMDTGEGVAAVTGTMTEKRDAVLAGVFFLVEDEGGGGEGGASDWGDISNTPTTLAGYGIDDAQTNLKIVSIEDYGAVGDDSTDNTTFIQDAIDAVCGTSWHEGLYGAVYIPNGIFRCRNIILRQGLKMYGESAASSVLKDIAGDTNICLIIAPEEVLSSCELSNFSITGVGVTDKMGIYFPGVINPTDDLGGVTDSIFLNLIISGFHGHSWWWRGNTTDSVHAPMQLSTIRKCVIHRGTKAGARGLLFTSTCDQVLIETGQYYTSGDTDEAVIEISREWANGGVNGGISVGGTPFVVDTIMATITFIGVTIYSYGDPANSTRGIILERANSAHFVNCWWENISRPLEIHNSYGVLLSAPSFIECGSDSGNLVKVFSGSGASDVAIDSPYIVNGAITLGTAYVGVRRVSSIISGISGKQGINTKDPKGLQQISGGDDQLDTGQHVFDSEDTYDFNGTFYKYGGAPDTYAKWKYGINGSAQYAFRYHLGADGINNPATTFVDKFIIKPDGTIKITGGSPGSGKVLTSDADGDATWENVPVDTHSTLTYAGTTDIDFNSAANIRTLSLTGDVTFTTSNKAAAKSRVIRILSDGTIRNFTFPAWKFQGTAPTTIAAGKTAMLSLLAFGTADTDILAGYTVED
jgi:hypothetical protein